MNHSINVYADMINVPEFVEFLSAMNLCSKVIQNGPIHQGLSTITGIGLTDDNFKIMRNNVVKSYFWPSVKNFN